MIDRLKRFREPAAIVALLVVLFQCGATIVRFVIEARTAPVTTVMRGTTGLFGLVDAMVLTALTLSCVMVVPVTRWAKQLTLVSAVIMAIGALSGLVLLVGALLDPAGWFSRFLESLGGIAEIVFKALFAWLLWNGFRAVVELENEPAAAPVPVVPDQTAVPPDPTRAPTWSADAATGVVWRRAGDAATGAAAATYDPGAGGWTPAPVAELPAIRPDGSLLPPIPGDPQVIAAAEVEAAAPVAPRAVRVIVGDDEVPGPRRAGPPSWDPAEDISRPARGE
ncbi:MAG TPA: hypothetical protein PKM36_09085 [Propionibacteriaceae bacterium]|nr:hypothetical protein [Propionibacteriaceae bacterium]